MTYVSNNPIICHALLRYLTEYSTQIKRQLAREKKS
jgi:hypothetical protein